MDRERENGRRLHADRCPLGVTIPADLIEAYHYPLMLEVINDRWQQAGRGVTLEILLALPNGEEGQQIWQRVAADLSTRLLSLGKSYGLYLHTADLAFDTVRSWVRAATSDESQAFIDLDLTSRPHVVPTFTYNTETVRCCLFQTSRFGAWIGALWADTALGNFFFPDFVLTVYEGDVTKEMDRDAQLTEATFAATLDRTLGGLIPYGDPPLFIMGLPLTSDLYRSLVASTSPELLT